MRPQPGVGRLKPAPPEQGARGGERGFALLLVFLMAAVIGIMLYAQLPRVAMQSQRAKEQLLIERGEQFKRAIQLFLRANKGTRYPADIDDLDRGYNNLRFLRHRYKDPMTGKDEWRIIHVQGGVLTDSLLNKPKDSGKPEDTTLGQNISALPGLGELANQGQASPNATSRRRASEGGTGGGVGPDGQPIQPGSQPNGAQPGAGPTAGFFQPGGATGGTGQQPPGTPGTPGGPVMPFGAAPAGTGIPGMPGQFPGQFPGQPPGLPGQPGMPGSNPGANNGANGQNAGNTGGGSSVGDYGSTVGGGTLAGTQGNAAGLAGGQNPANAANPMAPGFGLSPSSPAGNMLNALLGGPKPGGFAGLGQTQGTVIGGGMAGVASKLDAEGITVYNDRTNYKEWEFVYDPSKDRPRQDPRSMLVGNQMGTPSTSTASSSSSPFSSPGMTTSTGQAGTFNQPAQTGTSGQIGPGGQTGANGQTSTPGIAGGYGQGGTPDIRPGRR
ncbi:MAG: hypothetical protein ACLQPN_07850 [Bryobacteraceae bacterium]